MNTRKTAEAGYPLGKKAIAKLEKFTRGQVPPVVQAKTDAKQGQWFCADCGEALQNNINMQSHTKSHRVCWWTGEHCEEP